MNVKFICLILFTSYCSCGISYIGDVNNFEDLFSDFDGSSWETDYGTKHCRPSPIPGGCVWNQNENLRHVQHNSLTGEHWKTNELRISVRNDCEEDHCCFSDARCTSFTSAQISSKKLFGYGSFSFMMKINKQVKEFEIKSTSFKSVYCAHSPSSDMFPSILRRKATSGYCEIDNADLGKFSSNQDLCHSFSMKPSEKQICARYGWVIEIFAPSTFRFKANGRSIDYVTTAIYVGDELVSKGGRDLIQDFEITLETKGMHKVEIFGFEDCCAGSRRQGYGGWNIHRQQAYTYSEGQTSPMKMPVEKHAEALMGLSNHVVGNVGVESQNSITVDNIANIQLGDSSFEETTREPPTFTTEEEFAESTAEVLCSDLHCSEDISSPCDPNCPGPSSSSDSAGPSSLGQAGENFLDLMASESDCSSCSEPNDQSEDMVMYFLRLLNPFYDMLCVLDKVFDWTPTYEQLSWHSRLIRTTFEAIYFQFVLEQEALQDNWFESGTLLSTIRELQTMVKDALNRCRQMQNETGSLPPEILHDLMSVYESLVHVEGMLEPHLMSDSEDSESDYEDTTTDAPEFDRSSTPGINNPMSSDDDPFPPSQPEFHQVSSTTSHANTAAPDPGSSSYQSLLNYGALHCFMLHRVTKATGKIGICLFNLNSRRAIIFAGIGQKVFKEIVKLPFDAAKKIGRYRIDWLPTGITWNADNRLVGSISQKQFPIPDGSLRMKFYSAPVNPTQAPDDFLIEQTMQLFSVQYQNHRVAKDELRLTFEPQDKRYILILLLVGAITTCTCGCLIYFRTRLKTQIPTGYTILAEREEMI